MFQFSNIVTISLTLFAVIDILGSVPTIIDLRGKIGDIPALKATLVSGGIMVGFFFIGDQLLNLIGIDIYSFALAGAVVIFIVAMEMVLDREFFKQHSNPLTGAIVPLAFPLIAGAGTLTTLVSLKANFSTAEILVSVLVNLIFVYLVLKTTHLIERLLGPSGIAIFRRVFGIILLAIAIKIVSSNIGKVLHPDTVVPTAVAPAAVEAGHLPG
jgi:multiple antibiotic resistance protein